MNTDTQVYQAQLEQRTFMSKVYGWMSLALLITGFVAYFVASTPSILKVVLGNMLLFYGLIIAEILLVGYLAVAIKKMSAARATAVFIGYSALNGLTMSFIFVIYTSASIASTFFITAGMFAVMSIYGFVTKKDLTGMGSFMMMGLFGIIIASIVNMFFKNQNLYWVITYIGVIIFVGLTAYDTQKIKNMNIIGNEGTDEGKKEAIIGALTLYLDFINLFLMLLRIFGNRKGDWK
jgi:uncharacterized protein